MLGNGGRAVSGAQKLVYALNHLAFRSFCTFVFQSLVLGAVNNSSMPRPALREFLESLFFLLTLYFWKEKLGGVDAQMRYVVEQLDAEQNARAENKFDWVRQLFKVARNLCFNLGKLNKINNHFVGDIQMHVSPKEVTLLQNVSVLGDPARPGHFAVRNQVGPFRVDVDVSPAFQEELMGFVSAPGTSFLVTPLSETGAEDGESCSSTFSKLIFFSCFYNCASYLKETPLERAINSPKQEMGFFQDSLIFARFIDEETFRILLEKFVSASKPLPKKAKEAFFQTVADFFSKANSRLVRVRDLLSDLLLAQISENGNGTPFRMQLTRLVKSMFMKFRLNFITLVRLNFRIIRHVRNTPQQIRFFWGLVSSFCDLVDVGLVRDTPKVLSSFLEDKYLLPHFVRRLLEHSTPLTSIQFFPVFFKFSLIVWELGLRFFHYEFLFKFCQIICKDLDNQTNISNIDQDCVLLTSLFPFLDKSNLLSLLKVLLLLAELELPVLVPTLVLVSAFFSKGVHLENQNIFFHDLCHLLINKVFVDQLAKHCSDASISTSKTALLFSKCYAALLEFFDWNIFPVYKVVLIGTAWAMRPVASRDPSALDAHQALGEAHFATHWTSNVKPLVKQKPERYKDAFKDFGACQKFLRSKMGKAWRPKPNVFKKMFERTQPPLLSCLAFPKSLRLSFHIFEKIRKDIRRPSEDLFWTSARKFDLLTHFNEIFRALSLVSHFALRHLFFGSSARRRCRRQARRAKKELFLRGSLRVPVHRDTLYLFSMCLQVKSSFCVRNTRLKLVDSARLNGVSQNFELDPQNPCAARTRPRPSKRRPRSGTFLRESRAPAGGEVANLKEFFEEAFKKKKSDGGKVPAELALLTHLFGLSPQEKLLGFCNAAQTRDFNRVVDGLLVLTDARALFAHHIQLGSDGRLCHIHRPQSRNCPYLNYLEEKFEPFGGSEGAPLELKLESLWFHSVKEIHQKPCMLRKIGLEVFLESGKTRSFVLPLGKYQGFFSRLVRALSEFFLGNDSFMNSKQKGFSLEDKENFFIIIQKVGCGKTLDFKTKRGLTLDLFAKINQDLVDNFSLLAGFNILAGKSLSQNNNSFVFPLLSPSPGQNCHAKYSSRESSKPDARASTLTESPGSRVFHSTSSAWHVVGPDSKSSDFPKRDMPKLVNVRHLARHSGFNPRDFGEALRFLEKRVFSKRCADTDDFEDTFHEFDRMTVSKEQLHVLQEIWSSAFLRATEGKAVNLSKMKLGERLVVEKVPLTCLQLLQSMLRELLRPDALKTDLAHAYHHLDLFSGSHFLMRAHPFTEFHLWTKSSFDNMNRTFNSFSEHFSVMQREASSQEIVPFVYCCPEVFFNANCLEHRNFSGFKLPRGYANAFYQSFVDDLYLMLLRLPVRSVAKWISLVLDNRDSRGASEPLFGRYFRLFYSAPRSEDLRDPALKAAFLEKLFLSNQGSTGVHYNKVLRDLNYGKRLYSRNKRSLEQLQNRPARSERLEEHHFTVESTAFQMSITKPRRLSGSASSESEELSPQFASPSNSQEAPASGSESEFHFQFREKRLFDSCGPLKKFLSSTNLSRDLTLSCFERFLMRRDLHLLFEFENTLLVFSQQFRREFLWVTTNTGRVTCQMFFDFDESVPVLGNSQGQVVFLQLSRKSRGSLHSPFFDQCLLQTSFLNFNFLQNFNHFPFFELRSQKSLEDTVTLRTLAVSHLWTAHYSAAPVSSLRRCDNTKFLLCGNAVGKVLVLDFFARALIREFDSLSLRSLSLLKTMFVSKARAQSMPQSQSQGSSFNTLLLGAANDFQERSALSPGLSAEGNSQNSREQTPDAKYLALNKSDFLMGPVLWIDVNAEDKILVVALHSFSLFNANGALLSIYFEESPRADPFRKGFFLRENKLERGLKLALVTQNARLCFFSSVENTADAGRSSAQNFNYFLNSSRFFFHNALEIFFEKVDLHLDALHSVYNSPDYSVVEVFLSRPNVLFLVSLQKQDLRVIEVKVKFNN